MSASPETNPTSACSSFSRWWSCKICFTGRLSDFLMLMVQNGISYEHGCRWPCLARGLTEATDWSSTCASRQRGPAGLENSLGSRERGYKKNPVADANMIGFEQALLLFLCGRETSSEARMKFQPYLRECVWDSGTQQEKRASAFSGFLLLSSCAKDSLPYLNFKVFKTLLGF